MNNIFYPKQLVNNRFRKIENQCFFAMPFSEEYTNVYDTLSLYLSSSNYKPIRVDNNSEAGVPIINLILTGIATSQYIIVDISDKNANVFYELGIAQTLKEPENIFIIKESSAKTPFDIQHLQYIQYDKNNLKKLAETLLIKLDACQFKNDFWNAVNSENIIDINQIDMFSEYCIDIFHEDTIKVFTDILENSNSIYPLSNEKREAFWKLDQTIRHEINQHTSAINISMLFLLLYRLTIYSCEDAAISNYIQEFLKLAEFESLRTEQLISYQTDFAIELAKKEKLYDISMQWIISYFKKSKSTKVDLNRYKLESFLLCTENNAVNEYIVNALFSDNHYIREHMADIVGEKKLLFAEDNLIAQLNREDNIYTLASIMEAIGKIKSFKGAYEIFNCMEAKADELINKENFFVLKHARNSLIKIGNQELMSKFDQKYYKLLEANHAL